MKDYKKLNKQPLKFVLAEFCFSPVMQIAEYVPKFQEALRKQYPISDKKSEQAIQVHSDGIAVSAMDRWSFMTGDNKSAVEITQERLIYYTAAYLRFEGFAEACEQALKVLAEIVEPNLILRIGLRYSDLVTLEENEAISTLVDTHFAFPAWTSVLGKSLHQRSETFIATELGRLAIRTLYGHHSLSYLPDIQKLPVRIEKVDSPSERMILDFDHHWESNDQAISFEVDKILNKLNTMHEITRKAFWQMTTDYARNKKWA